MNCSPPSQKYLKTVEKGGAINVTFETIDTKMEGLIFRFSKSGNLSRLCTNATAKFEVRMGRIGANEVLISQGGGNFETTFLLLWGELFGYTLREGS